MPFVLEPADDHPAADTAQTVLLCPNCRSSAWHGQLPGEVLRAYAAEQQMQYLRAELDRQLRALEGPVAQRLAAAQMALAQLLAQLTTLSERPTKVWNLPINHQLS